MSQELHKDWLPIVLPDSLPLLRLMLWWENFLRTGPDMTGPIERKITRLEKECEK